MTIEKLMQTLDLTREQAEELIESDKKVDKMTKISEINADLSQEQQKNAKKMKNVGEKVVKTTVNRPIDEEKQKIICDLANFLIKNGQNNAKIANQCREITFSIGNNKYSLTLTKHNK